MKLYIVIPAFNEEKILEPSVVRTVAFCRTQLDVDWKVIIVDNGSTDNTAAIGKSLSSRYSPEVSYLHTNQSGKGGAIKLGWQALDGDIYIFMDADLATDIRAIPVVVSEMKQGYDVVIGSRTNRASVVQRSMVRKFFSWGYKIVVRLLLATTISDAPCGFKAINHTVRSAVLPQVKDNHWFFDSELVILAEKMGFKIKEIPVVWSDPRTRADRSRVKTLQLSFAYFKAVLALRHRLK